MNYTKKQIEIINKMEELVSQRLTLSDLKGKIQRIFNNDNIDLVDVTSDKDDNDLSDYNLMFSNETLDDLYGYYDIYYLKTRDNDHIYITGVGYEFE